MIFLTNGCSMASGFECTMPSKQSPEDYEYAWPAQLCNINNVKGINLSKPGQSNWSIATNLQSFIIENLHIKNELKVIVGWTDFHRHEFVDDNNEVFNINTGVATNIKNKTYIEDWMKRKDVKLAVDYWLIQSLDSRMSYFSWIYFSLKNFLENYKIPYLFFNSISDPIQPKKDAILNTPSMSKVWDILHNDKNYYQEVSQFDWLKENYPTHTTGDGVGQPHWNPIALRAWAEFLSTKIT